MSALDTLRAALADYDRACVDHGDVIDRIRRSLAAGYACADRSAEDVAALLADRDAAHLTAAAERTRADAAEAECARLRANEEDINDVVTASCGWARHAREMEAERDAARAEADALRAIVEGRCEPPTPQEIDHHWRMGGAWLVGRSVVTDRAEALRLASVGVAGVAWVALDGMLRGGRPCPWPTVAAEAATGAALAGEGR